MIDAVVAWDGDDDPRGNVRHIAAHDVTKKEVEEALSDPDGWPDVSRTSGRDMWFGRTNENRPLAVVYETISDDPWIITVKTTYEVSP